MVPPPGVPEKYFLRVMFLEEPPFIQIDPPEPVSGKCINRGVVCYVNAVGNSSEDSGSEKEKQCCSGFSIDLLEKFSSEMGFLYDLIRVDDGHWGSKVVSAILFSWSSIKRLLRTVVGVSFCSGLQNGQWNGLVAALMNRKADMVMTSFTINSMRESVIDFSAPFMQTGIAIVVAKRTGIISPKAFLG